MTTHNKIIHIATHGQGLYEITDELSSFLHSLSIDNGLCNVFVQHTSASLIIQENADPSAREDLENWLNRLVKEKDPLYTHTTEGPDDMPAHIKSVLTSTSLTIPVIGGSFALGTWQGVYLWEHRKASHKRKILISIVI